MGKLYNSVIKKINDLRAVKGQPASPYNPNDPRPIAGRISIQDLHHALSVC